MIFWAEPHGTKRHLPERNLRLQSRSHQVWSGKWGAVGGLKDMILARQGMCLLTVATPSSGGGLVFRKLSLLAFPWETVFPRPPAIRCSKQGQYRMLPSRTAWRLMKTHKYFRWTCLDTGCQEGSKEGAGMRVRFHLYASACRPREMW